MSHLPYTYYLKWTSTGMKYYGVRFAKKCDPNDLWNPYKTSSKYVTQHTLEHGEPDVISIRKVFTGEHAISDARDWENRILRRLKVVEREDFLNKTDNKAISPECAAKSAALAAPKRRGRTKENDIGVAAQAEKMRGRTKETNPGIAAAVKKRTGRSKETDLGVAAQAEKIRGRTKETHLYLASKKKGHTKDTNNGIASQAEKLKGRTRKTHPYLATMGELARKRLSKNWIIETPIGEKLSITNLKAWCEENNFPRGTAGDSVRSRGYTFHLTSNLGN